MEFPAVVAQGARAYPALLPLVLISVALIFWACEHRRWLWASAAGILGCAVCLLYIGSPAAASLRLDGAGLQAAVGPVGSVGMSQLPSAAGPVSSKTQRTTQPRPLVEPGRFFSNLRLHPRFPRDFPIPRSFRLESNSGGARSGNLTVRFRFTGEPANAVCDLREQGRAGGWSVDVLAPHRVSFHKNGRIVEAWFSYPAHSVVLDIPDQQ